MRGRTGGIGQFIKLIYCVSKVIIVVIQSSVSIIKPNWQQKLFIEKVFCFTKKSNPDSLVNFCLMLKARGFNGWVHIPENCDFRSSFDLLNLTFSSFIFYTFLLSGYTF